MVNNIKNSKTAISTLIIALVVILVVAVVAGGLGAYYLSTQQNSNTTPTPAPTDQPTATPSSSATTQSPAPSSAINVTQATSLQYSISVTGNETDVSYVFYGKNIGTNKLMIRVETTTSEGNQTYIFNQNQTRSWMMAANQWTNITDSFNTYYPMWNNLWTGYVNALASSWMGSGDYSFSSQGTTVRIHDISINPNLDNALFEHS